MDEVLVVLALSAMARAVSPVKPERITVLVAVGSPTMYPRTVAVVPCWAIAWATVIGVAATAAARGTPSGVAWAGPGGECSTSTPSSAGTRTAIARRDALVRGMRRSDAEGDPGPTIRSFGDKRETWRLLSVDLPVAGEPVQCRRGPVGGGIGFRPKDEGGDRSPGSRTEWD